MDNATHLSSLIQGLAAKYGGGPALTFRSFGSLKWKTVSWERFGLRVSQVSNALLNLGVKPQENIAVFSQNCVQYLYTNFGAYGVRAATVPIYATSSEQQIQYVVNDAGVRFLFVGEQEQYDKAHRIFALCPTLERIIIYDGSVRISTHDPAALYFEDFIKLGEGLPRRTEVEALLATASMDDIADILYTSGTTGESKGVVLTYGQYAAAIKANRECVPVGRGDRVMSFLPYAHIFERAWAYLSMACGAEIIINTYPKEIQQSMAETNPTCMSSVPRFWEKVYQAVWEKIDAAGPVKKKLFLHALEVGRRHNVEYRARGRRAPLALKAEYAIVSRTVLGIVRKQLGLVRPNIFPTAGATVTPAVEEFVHAIGIDMIVGYGLTESLATVSCLHKGKAFTMGSVGFPIKGIDIKISEEGEILLKGPTITKGYYKRDGANAEAFDKDGYFRTGDAGYVKDGELFLTDRIKDLFKTSNGKYIAPQSLEAMLLVDKFIDQAAVIADKRKFVSALIVPEFRILEEWAREHSVPFSTREELCADRRVRGMLMERVATMQQHLSGYEQVKRIALLPHHFSMEAGELTNTLKMKRRVIDRNYKDIIDSLYED